MAKDILDRLADKILIGDGCWEPVTAKQNVRRSPIHFANRTHCPQGHPYDAVNTLVRPYKGGYVRTCKTCERWTGTGKGSFNARKTHCAQGHLYDESNTSIKVDGSRCCLACARERERVKRAKRKVAAGG